MNGISITAKIFTNFIQNLQFIEVVGSTCQNKIDLLGCII